MNIFTYYSRSAKNVVFSISIYIIMCFLILLTSGFIMDCFRPIEQSKEHYLIDVDENIIKFNDGPRFYTSDGRIVVCSNDKKNIAKDEIYDPESNTFSAASMDDINNMLLPAKNINRSIRSWSAFMEVESDITLPVIDGNDLTLWKYDREKQYFTAYKNRKIVGYFDRSGFKDSLGEIKKFAIEKHHIWQNESRLHIPSGISILTIQQDGLYCTDFAGKENRLMYSIDTQNNIKDWYIYSSKTNTPKGPGEIPEIYTDAPEMIFINYKNKAPELLTLHDSEYNSMRFDIYNVNFSDYYPKVYMGSNKNNIYLELRENSWKRFTDSAGHVDMVKLDDFMNNEYTITTNISDKAKVLFYKIDIASRKTEKLNEYVYIDAAAVPANYVKYNRVNRVFRNIFRAITPRVFDANILKSSLGRILDGFDIMFNKYANILTLVCMAVVCLHQYSRKQSKMEFAGWVIIVTLFNVAGLLTYLIFNHCRLIKCPSCNKSRHVRADACPHCQSPLPTPATQETDIITR